MSNMIDNITGGYKSSAKVNAGTLVLSLPDAVTPVVWRMDLNTAKSSAIEIRENEDGQYELILKTPKADAHSIATYQFKIKATQALMAITKAMKKAESYDSYDTDEDGKKRYLPVPVTKSRFSPAKILIALYIILSLGFFAFLGLGFVKMWGVDTGPAPLRITESPFKSQSYDDFLHDDTLDQPAAVSQEEDEIRKKVGEVISADDFLRKK